MKQDSDFYSFNIVHNFVTFTKGLKNILVHIPYF